MIPLASAERHTRVTPRRVASQRLLSGADGLPGLAELEEDLRTLLVCEGRGRIHTRRRAETAQRVLPLARLGEGGALRKEMRELLRGRRRRGGFAGAFGGGGGEARELLRWRPLRLALQREGLHPETTAGACDEREQSEKTRLELIRFLPMVVRLESWQAEHC